MQPGSLTRPAPSLLARLPQVQERARRVPHRRRAAGLGDVERLGQHLAAELADPRRQRVDVLDRHVRRPVRRQRAPLLLVELVQRGDVAPVDPEHRVRALIADRGVDRLPAEHARVELLRRVGVGRAEVGPAERPRRVALTHPPSAAAYDSSERPVICSGWSIASSARMVGATSARMPSPSSRDAVGGDDERHRVERVRGVDRPVLVEHVVRVAVVGGDHARAAARPGPPRPPRRGTRRRSRPPSPPPRCRRCGRPCPGSRS